MGRTEQVAAVLLYEKKAAGLTEQTCHTAADTHVFGPASWPATFCGFPSLT